MIVLLGRRRTPRDALAEGPDDREEGRALVAHRFDRVRDSRAKTSFGVVVAANVRADAGLAN